MSQRTRDAGAIERNSVIVLNEVDRLDQMIQRLLYFSRPIRLQLQEMSLRALCTEALETWQPRCRAEVMLKTAIAWWWQLKHWRCLG